jgi:hypothetical protein
MDAYSTDIDTADEAKWEQADAAHDQQQEESGMKIREQDDYDLTPDPDDMTYTEAQIADRMTTFAGEINTINNVATAMTRDALSRFGLAASDRRITVHIIVLDPEETINWIDQPRQHIDLRRIAEHVHGDATVAPSPTGKNHLYIMPKGGTLAGSTFCITGRNDV